MLVWSSNAASVLGMQMCNLPISCSQPRRGYKNVGGRYSILTPMRPRRSGKVGIMIITKCGLRSVTAGRSLQKYEHEMK